LNGLKKWLEDAKGNRLENLYQVLWSYGTTLQSTTGETPYSLVELMQLSRWKLVNRPEGWCIRPKITMKFWERS
jgi:hypothetical protein